MLKNLPRLRKRTHPVKSIQRLTWDYSWYNPTGATKCSLCARLAEYKIEYFSGASVWACERHVPTEGMRDVPDWGTALESPEKPPKKTWPLGAKVTGFWAFLTRAILGK